jgi:AcrR family transcriptional regulator
MNKNESKYFNTAIKMDEALLSLLEKKDFEYITIKEICDSAGVNRSTFYLHYENTYDLLKETTQYILDKHWACYSIDKKDIVFNFESCDRTELIFITRKYLVPYLTFIKNNCRIFKLTIRQFRLMNMDEVYVKMFEHIFKPVLERFDVPLKERAYVIKFYLMGVFAIVMEWLDKDCREDMDFIIKVINDCVLGMRKIEE